MSENSSKTLSIVIPVFNERSTIEPILKKVSSAPLPTNWKKEIIVVDDGSTDGTRDVLRRYTSSYNIIFREQNGGKGAALKDGFKAATGEYILIQDADAEYDPADYRALLEPIDTGKADVVFGSRVMNDNAVPFSQVYFYGGLLITKVFNFLCRSKLTDLATCYKIFPRSYVPELVELPSDDFVFDVVELSFLLLRKGRVIMEVPITYSSRKKEEGKKMNWRHGWRCFRKICALVIVEKGRQLISLSKVQYAKRIAPISRREGLSFFLVFSLFFLVFSLMYLTVFTLSSNDDHFFHFRFAQEMLSNGFFESFQNFKSLYFSKMAQGNEYFVYYNFLFYLVIIPFTFITPLYLGIKLYAVFVVSLIFTLLYWCFKRFSIHAPFIWVFLIIAITNVSGIWRFFLSRPYVLAPTLLVLLLVFLYRKNYWAGFLLGFLYFYWHSATFFFPACVAIAYFIIEKFYHEKSDYKAPLMVIVGTATAWLGTYIVSSGFIYYMRDIIFGTYIDTIIGKKVNIAEGGELYPLNFFNVIQTNSVIFAAFVTALAIDIYSYCALKFGTVKPVEYFGNFPKRRHLQTTVLLLTATFFLGTVSFSARFGDYFTLFAGLYIALSFDSIRRSIIISGDRLVRRSVIAGLTIVLLYLFVSNILFLQERIAYGARPDAMYQIGTWLNKNSKPGEIVFINNWSWFPELYYHSPKNNYISGLEPRFMYDHNKEIYWLSVNMPSGFICDREKCLEEIKDRDEALRTASTTDAYVKSEGDKMADILRKRFTSTYIVTHRDFRLFDYILDHNDNFNKEFYNDESGYFIFSVKHATSTQ